MIEPGTIQRLVATVGAANVHTDAATRRALSRDYSWMSPILRHQLDGRLADVTVAPATPEEAAQVLGVAFEHGVPVTPRGRGTGNYGQAVPLAGGILLDMSRLNQVLDVGSGWISAQAGVNFVRLEADARRSGQELAMFPSTTASALGGFLGGGAGGTGSIAHGFIWDGFVAAVQVAPCRDDAVPSWVEGAEAVSPFLHAYGTTGLMTAASVRLVPATEWTALFASFGGWAEALGAAWALLNREPRPRNLAVDEPALVAALPSHPAMPKGRVSLRALVPVDDAHHVGRVIESARGRVGTG
jgi:FAD/FMN-containing dehydrogenase